MTVLRQTLLVLLLIGFCGLVLYDWWAAGPAIVAGLLVADGWHKPWRGWRHE